MRADRLVATLLLMQARGRVTAAEIAEELEVSVATARRDLLALSGAGVPVYPQPGRGGGWSLLGEGRTDLSGFTASEARALFLLLGPRAGESSDARSALRKVLRALPATFREEAQAAADAVVVDPGRWGASADAGPGGPSRSEGLDVLERAVVERRHVRFAYAAWGREPRPRRVAPLGLVEKAGVRYLIARIAPDVADGGERGAGADRPGPAAGGRPDSETRTYRVDRMSRIEPDDEVFELPEGFDLAAAWAEASAAIEGVRAQVRAEVLVDPAAADEFAGWTGARRRGPSAGDGRIPMELDAPAESVLLRRLAGWGDTAEVTSPATLRADLAALGSELARRHGAPAPGG
ncbi:helix-turn-helix transcriptional regulator [Agromyces sp. MMS24-JH15]|uniref:helix-turn-helix transcriptional regulator n=1 Tax=Agromyces sp. MMS24-JH15 TaxID=3243765 RepID=UPI00374995EA